MNAEDIPIYVVKIGIIKFSVREDLFRTDAVNIRYNIEHQLGFNGENNWVSFKVRVFYAYPDNMNEIVMDIVVETVFLIENLKDYVNISNGPVTTTNMNLPSIVLIKIAEMGLSHTRALLSQSKANSLFYSINLPYIDPVESAKKFFGGKVKFHQRISSNG